MPGSWLCNYLLIDLMLNELCIYKQLSLTGGVKMVEIPIAKDSEYARPD